MKSFDAPLKLPFANCLKRQYQYFYVINKG